MSALVRDSVTAISAPQSPGRFRIPKFKGSNETTKSAPARCVSFSRDATSSGQPKTFGCSAGIGHIHSGQFYDHRLKFEKGLQGPLTRFRLIGSLCGIEFSPRRDFIHHNEDVVIIGSTPHKAAPIACPEVLCGQASQFLFELDFR